MARKGAPKGDGQRTGSYTHPTATALMRPEIGTQAQFRKKKPKARYRYDSSLSPALDWDGQNPAREEGEALIRQILEAQDLAGAKAAAEKLRALSKPFLDWAGKAERLSFDVPTLPLFIHERLSTRAIVETLKGHKRDRQLNMFDLFGDRGHPIHEQQNRRGAEIGGIVPHITSSTIANDEPPAEEILVDRPEVDRGITRVSPFCVEATIPTPMDWENGDPVGAGPRACPEEGGHTGSPLQNHVDRMLEVLRKSSVLHVGGGKQVTLQQVRSPAKTLCLSAEAVVELPVAGCTS